MDLNAAGAPRRQASKGGFRTAEEAQKALTRLHADKEAGKWVEPSKATVGAYLASWLEAKDDIRASTSTSYRAAVARLTPIIGTVALQNLSKQEVMAAYKKLGQTPTRHGRPPAKKTVHLVHLALHSALKDALDDGLIRRNVADGAHKAPKADEQPEMATWAPSTIKDFLDFCGDDDLYPLLWLAAFTGMRRGELLGLRWSDLTLDGGFLSVRQQVARKAAPDGTDGIVWGFGPPKRPRRAAAGLT